MSSGEKPELKMSLDDVIKKRLKEDKNSKLRPLMRKGRRRFQYRKKYDESKEKKDSRRRIRVENLNKEMQNPDLAKLFEKYGKLTRCGIKFDKMGASKGIADIEFSTHEECEKAIGELDNADINGEKIRVKYAPNLTRRISNARRVKSASIQRRNLRKLNRSNRRRVRSTNRTGSIRRRPRSSERTGFKPKRRYFLRTLGRKRKDKK